MKKAIILTLIFSIVIVAILIVKLVIPVLPFIISINLSGSYECVSIAHDKNELIKANRIVIKELYPADSKQIIEVEITDQSLIDDLVEETMVATMSNICNSKYRVIEVYCGDTLIRSMEWSGCCSQEYVLVYREDEKHTLWLTGYDGQDTGHVQLSQNLLQRLNAAFESGQ